MLMVNDQVEKYVQVLVKNKNKMVATAFAEQRNP